MSAKLRVVPPAQERDPETELGRTCPQLIAAEEQAKRLRAALLEQGRWLAKIRGVAFIREEHLRQEFGQ